MEFKLLLHLEGGIWNKKWKYDNLKKKSILIIQFSKCKQLLFSCYAVSLILFFQDQTSKFQFFFKSANSFMLKSNHNHDRIMQRKIPNMLLFFTYKQKMLDKKEMLYCLCFVNFFVQKKKEFDYLSFSFVTMVM